MKKQSGLAKRMKEAYQDAYNIKLPKRTNVIIRLDGKSFAKYTKGLKTPFDKDFAEDMNLTAKYLCEKIQGCKLAYVQSDEISLLLTDYDTYETSAWFDNKLQKLVSVSASMTTSEFNRQRIRRSMYTKFGEYVKSIREYDFEKFKMGEFDSRAFIISDKEEVVNYFLWRQQDATRNSISMTGQKYFSHRELENKSTSEVQEMLFKKEKVNWNDFPTRFKRGGCVLKEIKEERTYWKIDNEPPIFSQDRNYILNLIPKL